MPPAPEPPASPRWIGSMLALGASLALVGSCSVGTGSGSITGSLSLHDCGVEVTDYDLRPSFFVASYVRTLGAVDGENAPIATIRVQRGSYRESFSDGILVTVNDVNELVRSHLEEPIPLTQIDRHRERPLVDVTFYAGESCDAGYPAEFWRLPGILHAERGAILFHALYAPDLDRENTEISAESLDVEFASTDAPSTRRARLSGFFRFFYQRGAPAQDFP